MSDFALFKRLEFRSTRSAISAPLDTGSGRKLTRPLKERNL